MKTICIIACITFLSLPLISQAAELSFGSSVQKFSQDSEMHLDVRLDTQGTSVNAVEGSIVFPTDLLEFKQVREANSIISFWAKPPELSADGTVSFSGITPGGVAGPSNFLFTLVLKPKKIGSASIIFEKVRVLQNDGLGTVVETTAPPFTVSVSEKGAAVATYPADTVAPEAFEIVLGQDPNLFDGKHFIAFSTVDKGSGIDRYEVREGDDGSFVPATSPYLLRDQSLHNKIFVKAIDYNGNERVAVLDPEPTSMPYRNYLILGIVIVVLVAAYSSRNVWKKFGK